jgi:magnesium transporter
MLDPLHAADVADVLEQIDPADRRALLVLWHGEHRWRDPVRD